MHDNAGGNTSWAGLVGSVRRKNQASFKMDPLPNRHTVRGVIDGVEGKEKEDEEREEEEAAEGLFAMHSTLTSVERWQNHCGI